MLAKIVAVILTSGNRMMRSAGSILVAGGLAMGRETYAMVDRIDWPEGFCRRYLVGPLR